MQFVSAGEGRYGTPTLLRTYLTPLVVTGVAFLVPSEWLIWVFVVFGQGHFLMSFLYQYKAGKMRFPHLLLVLLLLVCFVTYLALFGESALFAFLFIALLFPIHFAYDEFTLYGERLQTPHVVSVLLFSALAFCATLSVAFPQYEYIRYALIMSTALLAFYAVLRVRTFGNGLSQAERYVWLVGLCMFALSLFGRPEQVLSAIIILHGFNWLVAFAYRVRGSVVHAREFWRAFWVTHSFGLIGLVAFFHLPIPGLKYFFALLYYDFWAISHVLLTAIPWKRSAVA